MNERNSLKETYSNRVSDAIYLYAEQETHAKIKNQITKSNDQDGKLLKLEYYKNISKIYSAKANIYEKLSLQFVKHEIAKLNAELHPTIVNRILYSNIGTKILGFINGYNLIYNKHISTIRHINNEITDKYNQEQLANMLKATGFNFNIEGTLQRMISHKLDTFHIHYTDMTCRNADFVLHFKKKPSTDLYYFEKFDAIARTHKELFDNNETGKRYMFINNDEYSFSAKEAANLVNNKSVCKNIDCKNVWYSLEITNRNGKHQFLTHIFDIDKSIQGLPIKQIQQHAQREKLIEALKTGSQKEVTFVVGGNNINYYIEACPKLNCLQIFDRNNNLLDPNSLLHNADNSTKLMIKISERNALTTINDTYKTRKLSI